MADTPAQLKDKSLGLLRKHIKGKKVLDVGCVGQVEVWARHEYIKNLKPSELIGVDIVKADKPNVEQRDLCLYDDALYMHEKYGKFEVIVMYDVIEHIDNTGSIIKNLQMLTDKNTLILISTPNAMSPKWLNQMKSGGHTKINLDHVHWFCFQTLSYLFKRYGYKSVEVVSDKLEPRLVQVFREI